MPKVTHLVISDLLGAGRAALRISEAVKTAGYESEVWVLNPGPLKAARAIPLNETEKLNRMITKKRNDLEMKGYPMPGYFHSDRHAIRYQDMPMIKNADLIHVHWINEGIYSDHFLKDMNRPVVWTLHDMWPFTGGCHYTGECRKFTARCGSCECLGSTRTSDLSTKGQQRRIQEYKNARLQFVGCSRWISEEANASAVLKESGKTCIPIANPIETRWFHARKKEECRKLLGIASDKKLILTGSINLRDTRKGASLLLEALRRLDPDRYTLCTFGNPEGFDIGGIETFSFGSVFDDLHLSLIYSACDVFCAPSIQENLANTVMESLACGTPTVAFDIGGMPDMIRSGFNGSLAQPFDVLSLANAIDETASKAYDAEKIASDTAARFGLVTIGKAYDEVYRNLLKESGETE